MRVKIIQEGKIYPQGMVSPMACRVQNDTIPIVDHYFRDPFPVVLGSARNFKRQADGWLTCEVPDEILPKEFEISGFFTNVETLNGVKQPYFDGVTMQKPVIISMRLRELAMSTYRDWEEHEDTSSPTQRVF